MTKLDAVTEDTLSRFWPKVDRRGPDDCWEWIAARQPNGYGKLSINGKEWEYAHRIAFHLLCDEELDGRIVMHDCDNKACVNPAHLSAGSHSENTSDAVERQGMNQGERNGQTKLTEDKVREMRRLYAKTDVTTYDLADRYGVSQDAAACAIRGDTWGHV